MLEMYGISDAVKFLTYLMLSFAFYTGIMLLVSEEAFEHFNAALQKEIGITRKIFPKLEETKTTFIDYLAMKYRIASGLFITISSFVLLLIYRF